MVVGLLFAALLIVLGVGAGARQFATLRTAREERFMPEIDRRYLRGQGRRRLLASGLFIIIGLMIACYYLSGMDARIDEIGEKRLDGAPPPEDREFTRLVGIYWIVVILLLGLAVLMAVLDFWATRVYWLARYREFKNDHDTKLQRDLAVFRQTRLNDRAKGLKKADDDTDLNGEPPLDSAEQ